MTDQSSYSSKHKKVFSKATLCSLDKHFIEYANVINLYSYLTNHSQRKPIIKLTFKGWKNGIFLTLAHFRQLHNMIIWL